MSVRESFDLIPKPAVYIAGTLAAGFAAVFLAIMFIGKLRVPEMLMLGLAGTFGASIIAVVTLLTGYVYADAGRRAMPQIPWTLLVLLVPNCIGFVLYFLLRKPLLAPCAQCGAGVDPGAAFCSRCGAARAVMAH